MAVNSSRNMRAELEQGLRDGTYMQLNPDWSINANPDVDRLTWPTYRQVEQHKEAPHIVINPLTPREGNPGTSNGGGLVAGLNA